MLSQQYLREAGSIIPVLTIVHALANMDLLGSHVVPFNVSTSAEKITTPSCECVYVP
jgi:hypothetical protein